MIATARRSDRSRVTISEFDAFLDDIDRKGGDASVYELLDGEIVMMTNPTRRHELIVANIGDRIGPSVRHRGCETYRGSMRVQARDAADDSEKPKPDVLVRCGLSSAAEQAQNFVTDPVLIIEVLSPSTARHDILKKVPFYASLPSSRHIVLVHQDERRIEHWHRQSNEAEWDLMLLPRDGETLIVNAVAFEITLDEVYEGVILGKL